MKIIVLSEYNMMRLLKEPNIDKTKIGLISIRSTKKSRSDNTFFVDNCRDLIPTKTLFLEFDDIDTTIEQYKNFTNIEAKKVIKFVEEIIKENIPNLICQCEMGISRSAAIAAAISKILTNDDNYFFQNYVPNSLVYTILLQEFEKRKDEICSLLTQKSSQ